MPTLEKLVDGFKIYKATIHDKQKDLIMHMEQAGIRPSTLVITSSDLQVSPDLMTSCVPGELYLIRLKAGLVPVYDPSYVSGFTATLEYAVQNHQVKNIVVLGHTHNDGLQMALESDLATSDTDPLRAWLGIAHDVAHAVKTQMVGAAPEQQVKAMELETVVMGIRNLFSYPWVADKVNKGALEIYGWHFDVETGELLGYAPNVGTFVPIE